MNNLYKLYVAALILLSALHTPLLAQTNQGKSITADFSVSPTGGMTYQVPFEVPSHVLSHFPDLGLSYNSQAGDGIAGWGWSISGLSSISRAPATKYHDGFIAPVDFTQTDRFTLDGQRLILKDGVYGRANSTYQTESYSNLKIEAKGTSKYGSKYGPSYFIVYHPNGLRYWYGLRDTSSLFGHTSSKLEWSIAKIEDTQGNTVKFRYNNPGNTSVLILNSVQDVTANIEVRFQYTNKDKSDMIGIGGQFFSNNRLLYRVRVNTGATNYMTYNFETSNTTNGNARVEEITQTNRDGNTLPSLKFNYTGNDFNYISSKRENLLNDDAVGDARSTGLVSGDFDGDDLLDFISFNYDREEADFKGIKYSKGLGDNFYTYSLNQSKTGEFENVFFGNYVTASNEISDHQGLILLKKGLNNNLIFEVNELKTDRLIKQREVVWEAPVQPETESETWNIPGARPQGWFGENLPIYFINSTKSEEINDTNVVYEPKRTVRLKPGFRARINNNSQRKFSAKIDFRAQDYSYSTGDFNGDAITDIIAIKRQTNNTTPDVYFIDLNPNSSTYGAQKIGTLQNELHDWSRILVGDFDGDGKSDIYHLYQENIKVYTTNANNALVYENTVNSQFFRSDTRIGLGDFNGDGKTDIFNSTRYDSSLWEFHISDGESFRSTSKDLGVFMKYQQSTANGRINYRKLNTPDECLRQIEDGDGNIISTVPCANHRASQFGYNYIPVDFDQDGKTDLISHFVASPIAFDLPYSHDYTYFLKNDSFNHKSELSPRSQDIVFTTASLRIRNNETRPYLGHPVFARFDNRNLQNQYAYVETNGAATIYKANYNYKQETCIESVENNGLITEFEYKGLMGNEWVASTPLLSPYTPYFSKEYKYPYVAYKRNISGLKIVNKVIQKFSGKTRSKQFRYGGLVSSIDGSGTYGFNFMTNSEWFGTDLNDIWTINEYDVLKKGILYRSWTTQGQPHNNNRFPSSNFISKTSYQYDKVTKPNGVYTYLPKQVVSTNGLTEVTTTLTNTYDSYYNVTQAKQVYNGGSKTVNNTYYNNPSGTGTSYYIGRPRTKNEKTTLGSENFSTAETYSYVNNFIKTLRTKGNNTSWLTETYEHDNFGNITSKTISGAGITNRTESSVYDDTGRFMLEATDIEGLTTTYRYNIALGHLLEETDPFGKTQSFEYDGWNRLTQQTDYLNNTIHTQYTGLSSGGLKITTTSSLGGGSETYINRLGWETISRSRNVLNNWVSTRVEYDAAGKIKRESQPVFGGNRPSQWTLHYYDDYNRPIRQQMYNGLLITTNYDRLTVTVDDQTKVISKTQDALGNTVSITDPGGTINYTYYANNTPKETVYDTHRITNKIDGWGRKIELNDPAAGKYNYTYNILGEVLTETTPKGVTTYELDQYGKPTLKTVQGDETNLRLEYTYDGTHKQIKQIAGTDLENNKEYTYTYSYDQYERLRQVYEATPDFSFSSAYVFDNQGRITQENRTSNKDGQFAPNFSVNIRNHYHPQSGQLYKISSTNATAPLWEVTSTNARGQLTEIALGNGVVKRKTYDQYGLPTSFEDKKGSNRIYASTFNFDNQRGNLLSRHNQTANIGEETYQYDSQDRLTQIAINGATATTQTYAANGNIQTNPQVGTYTYNTQTMYRVMGIDLNTQGKLHYQDHTPQNITYNAYKKPVSIHEQGHGRVDFEYGPMMNRSVAYYGGNSVSKTQRDYKKIYSAITPNEVVINNSTNQRKYIAYIGGDAYTAPIAYVLQPQSDGESGFMYLHRDHLGSIMAISNSEGQAIEKTHYSAWGEVAEYWDTQGNDTLGYTSILGRGYTGHEHFNSVGLIHMNGRMYDAKLRRFLSPDNFIQDPFNTQSFNRYGYVWNNPLKYNDPSGEFVFSLTAVLIGAAIGAGVGAATYAIGAAISGNWNWGDFAISVLGGALSGAIGGALAGEALIANLVTASSRSGFFAASIAKGVLASFLPGANFEVGDFNFSISPAIAFGNAGGIGANFSATYSDGDFSISAGVGITRFSRAHGTGNSGFEGRFSGSVGYDDGNFRASVSSTTFKSGETSQRVGSFSLGHGDFNATYQNDGWPFHYVRAGDGEDRYRTAAGRISYKNYGIGFNLFTGDFLKDGDNRGIETVDGHPDIYSNGVLESEGGQYAGPNASKYRLGALYTSVGGFRQGVNSEGVRHAIQNKFAHTKKYQPWFKVLNTSPSYYQQSQTVNTFSLW